MTNPLPPGDRIMHLLAAPIGAEECSRGLSPRARTIASKRSRVAAAETGASAAATRLSTDDHGRLPATLVAGYIPPLPSGAERRTLLLAYA